MNNNDILRRLRYTFDLNDTQVMLVFEEAGFEVVQEQLEPWFKKEGEEGYVEMDDRHMAAFLDGLIIQKRGRRESHPPVSVPTIDNNTILRKLKIALTLRDEDMVEIFKLAKVDVSKHEINAFFRKPSQSQYRPCLDQYLRNFLLGMQLRYRGN
jgi:uncharacterized protein YehS (DUF1456 family)